MDVAAPGRGGTRSLQYQCTVASISAMEKSRLRVKGKPAALYLGSVGVVKMLDAHLKESGSALSHLLALQVIFADITDRAAFEVQWLAWIGEDPAHWPQRWSAQNRAAALRANWPP